MTPAPLGIDKDDDGIVEDDLQLIPDGIYTVAYLFHETTLYKGDPKVVVHLSIVDDEDWSGLVFRRFYNVRSFAGKPKRFGGFRAGGCSKVVRQYRGLFKKEKHRRDRISLRRLEGRLIRARFRTTKIDGDGQSLPEASWYSVIDELIELVDQEQTDWQDQYQVATGSSDGVTR